MQTAVMTGVLAASYLLGSIPWGYILVKFKKGKDIRTVESGRIGGTNTMRAAGFWMGFITSGLDILKSAGAAWIARWIVPDAYWLHVAAPILAVVGHNYSIYLLKVEEGEIEFGGGAGGAPIVGGSIGLWWPSGLILIPLGMLIVFGVGYASIATLSLPLISSAIFWILSSQGQAPWQYIFLGVFGELLIVWALRPNIRRLLAGEERLVGWRAKKTDQE